MSEHARRGTAYKTFLKMQAQETDDCILWPYSKAKAGYGQVLGQTTHRLSCEMTYGPAPFPKAEAAHSCRNRHCFNPRHLRWATPAENNADKLRDGTHNRGSRQGQSRLTEDDVRLIRYQVAKGTKQSVFVKHFGVDPTTISRVVLRKNWAWL